MGLPKNNLAVRLADRLEQYSRLTRFGRPIGSLLLLWPTFWGLWIAGQGSPDPYVVLVFFLGVFLMRSAGCVINDYADREIDGYVERTRDRPLPRGRVSEREALVLFLVLSLGALALVLTLNRLTIYLSFVGIALAALYPFMKRVTHLPQLALGAAFSWGIPMAFAAQVNTVPGVAWWLVAANLCWVMAYDTIYAMVDRDDDLKIGVKSTAILLGSRDRLVMALCQIATLVILWFIGLTLQLGAYYFGGLIAAALFAAYQQWRIRRRERDACFGAFLNNAWFGAAVFAGILLAYL
ncbi:MAG: 4-hydroxybenzoate octaprenyltransferase [Gammaproteobacteria bacterium]|nr:4-hydroxybenzoate octaprenyltransferase [Gammaproteobacteria bacterium]